MTETELVTKLLAEGAKEFLHQWTTLGWSADNDKCRVCGAPYYDSIRKAECPVLLRAALDLTLKENEQRFADMGKVMDALGSGLDPETPPWEHVVQLKAALDLTRQQLAEALDPTVRE